MKSINIVHLSDLHISSNEEPTFERTRNNLIEDIHTVIKSNELNIDVVTMTGDTIDKANIKAYDKAEKFYSKLFKKLNLSADRLIMVPGNHDVPRKTILTQFLSNYNLEEFNNLQKSEEHWELFQTRFNKYFEFYNNVSNIDIKGNLFGASVKNIETDNGTFQFILFNSAWSCIDQSDYGKLLIGRWQLEKLIEIKRDLPHPDLTFGLMHHPLDWLLSSERETFLRYINDGSLKIDALLHGHIHNGKLHNISNPDGNLLSLVSGIGYPDMQNGGKGLPKLSSCRYAIYNINLETSEINVLLRISREDGNFVADTSLYLAGKENGQFTIPITTKNTQNSTFHDSNKMSGELDPVPIVSEWVGRKDEMTEIINPKLRSVAITGIGGQGKTTLAAEFFRRNSRKENALFEGSVWVDCRELPDSLHSKVIYLLEALSNGEESVTLYRDEKLEDTAKRLLMHLQKRKVLIVFDNIDAYIKADTEGPTKELNPFLNAILNNEHSSLVIFTCRPPFNDSRGTFHHIQLSGLIPEEGVEFFNKRGIKLQGKNGEEYCEKIVELTKGHPWWLGLIAGQVLADHDSLKNFAQKFSKGEIDLGARIKEYFSSIWRQLSKEAQKILRYLVEASRPLSESEILQIVELGPPKAKKQMRRLVRLGLLEPHDGATGSIMVYQVHPLIREFVHRSYSATSQQPFVYRVLCMFMHPSLVNTLFSEKAIEKDNIISLTPKNIVDSIETCLNSRNVEQALAILEFYYEILYDGGYHHEFISLACRVLDTLDWDKQKIVTLKRSLGLLRTTIKYLGYMGDFTRCSEYIKKYEYYLEPHTLQYVYFLNIKTYMTWLEGNFQDAASLAKTLEELADKLEVKGDFLNTLGLAIRDSGDYQKALEIFKEEHSEHDDDSNKATTLGNIARCYLKLGRYDESERLLGKSLLLSRNGNDYATKLNNGYAYLWIAETFYEQGKIRETSAFIRLCRAIWSEFAPGLLSTLDSSTIFKKSKGELHEISIEEAKSIEESFLSDSSKVKIT